MPYYLDPNLLDEEDQQNQQQQPKISGASPTTEPMSAGGGVGNKPLNTGSGYQNLEKYLAANNAPQFGQEVAGRVQNELTQAGESQKKAGETFGQQVNSANVIPTTDQVNSAIANPTGADPTQFQGWLKQNYNGPKSLGDSQQTWNDYWSGTNKAGVSAKELGNEPGRFALLDSYFGRPNYTYGEKSLDNLLLQQGGIGERTQGLEDQAAQLKAQGQKQALDLQNLATQRAGVVDTSRQGARRAIGLDDQNQVIEGEGAGAIGREHTKVNNEVKAENDKRKKDYDELLKALKGNSITPALRDKFGLIDNLTTYGVDPSEYLTYGGDVNKDQVLTPDERARIKALTDLAGINDTYANGAAAQKGDEYSFDTNQFTNKIAGKNASLQSASKNIVALIVAQNPMLGQMIPNSDQNPVASALQIRKLLSASLAERDPNATVNSNRFQQEEDQKSRDIIATIDQLLGQYNIDPNTGQSTFLRTS